MIIDIKAPTPGESIAEVEIASWLVADGDYVERNQDLAEIESDKATLTLAAPEAGKISIIQPPGESVAVGKVVCTIDTSVAGSKSSISSSETKKEIIEYAVIQVDAAKPEQSKATATVVANSSDAKYEKVRITPVARNVMAEKGWSVDDVISGLQRLSASDVEAIMGAATAMSADIVKKSSRETNRTKMSQLRKKLSQRLVAVKNETAMLTTFNEVDMSEIMRLRSKFQKDFVDKHGVRLGFMSFFIRAAALALSKFPMVNSMIEGEEIVTPDYADISVAVQAPKGLMVPVIRSAETLSLAQIEHELKELAEKARNNKLSLEEMSGGTFTITNGGVFGSMLSTPLINPPQSAILGMHNIIDRPVAVDGKVEIRPMMYVALSYDHRLIDGKDSVGFLTELKKYVEKPSLFLSHGMDIDKAILDLKE